MGKGRRYEHRLANDVSDVTTDDIVVCTMGYSGNALTDDADVMVVKNPSLCTRHEDTCYFIEAKKKSGQSGKRISDVFAGSSNEETGIEELRRLVEQTADWATSVVALKLDHRKLFVLNGRAFLTATETEAWDVPLFDVLKPRETRGGNVSVVKPTLDEWESSKAADNDENVLCNCLNFPTNDE